MLCHIAMVLAAAGALLGADAGTSVERRLYVTDRSGISVYDIDHGHSLLRKITIPDTGDYKGIAASPELNQLYVTSYKEDDLVCLDLKTDAILWRKKWASMPTA